MELQVAGVSHRYGDLPALENVDLTVQEGEILALIGPSGCGKSTLLGIIGGLLRPTAGRVVVHGEPPAGSLNPFTYIFQDFALLPWRTVRGNVALALEHHGIAQSEQQDRIADVLARTSLADFADAYPRQLSGGMRQRVGIARALAVKPAILLMDEPLSALDAQTRELLMEDFNDLFLRERTTAVYVTHNLNEALRVAHRVAVLSRRPGQLRELVAVDIPPEERGKVAHAAAMSEYHDRLWALIREEALVADREMAEAASG